GVRALLRTLPRHAAHRSRGPHAPAYVHEAGHAVTCRDPEYAEDLLAARAGRIRDTEPDAQCPLGESALHQGIESGQVGVGQRTMSPATARVARDRVNARERFVVRDECPARAHVAGADAV